MSTMYRSLLLANRSKAALVRGCAVVARAEAEAPRYREDEERRLATRRSMGSLIARATGIAFVGSLFAAKAAKAPEDDYLVPSALFEEDGDYHHEYFHSGVADRMVNRGCFDDDC